MMGVLSFLATILIGAMILLFVVFCLYLVFLAKGMSQ